MLASSRRNSPYCAFAVEVDCVLDSPKSPCDEDVIYRVNMQDMKVPSCRSSGMALSRMAL